MKWFLQPSEKCFTPKTVLTFSDLRGQGLNGIKYVGYWCIFCIQIMTSSFMIKSSETNSSLRHKWSVYVLLFSAPRTLRGFSIEPRRWRRPKDSSKTAHFMLWTSTSCLLHCHFHHCKILGREPPLLYSIRWVHHGPQKEVSAVGFEL